jgi:ATP-dependent DNA ligase
VVSKVRDSQYVSGHGKSNGLVYARKVDHGFDKKSAADLQKRLKPLIRKTLPYTKKMAHRRTWVALVSCCSRQARRCTRPRLRKPSADDAACVWGNDIA